MLGITDHALVRWLSRSGAMDMESLRSALSAALDRAASAAETLNAGEFVILADGLVFVVRDGAVITVMEDKGPAARARANQRRNAGGEG